MEQEQRRCLQNLTVFSRLTNEEIALICQKGYEKTYKKEQIIFFENDNGNKLYLLVSGQVKLTMLSSEGKEKVLTILHEGDIFGEISFFDHDPHPLTAEVLEDSSLMIITKGDLETIIAERPSVAIKIIEALAKKTRLLTSQIREMVFQDISGQLAALLKRFSHEFGKEISGKIMIDLILTHQDIANLLGSSRVTVTKLLNKFIDQGIIKIHKRKIVILDKEKLEEKIKL